MFRMAQESLRVNKNNGKIRTILRRSFQQQHQLQRQQGDHVVLCPATSFHPSIHALKTTHISNAKAILLRPAIFAAAVCFGSFGLAAIARYEKSQKATVSDTSEPWRTIPPFLRKRLSESTANFIERIANSETMDALGPIVGLNVAVFAMIKLSRPPNWLYRFFHSREYAMRPTKFDHFLHKTVVHYTTSGKALPLLLSCFCHQSVGHLGWNMVELAALAFLAVEMCGSKEQFWATYVSAGTLSSFGNVCISLVLNAARGSPMGRTIGASGAIVGIMSVVASADDLVVKIWVSFVVFNDLNGLMNRNGGRKKIAYAAHLAGVTAGYLLAGARVAHDDATLQSKSTHWGTNWIRAYQNAVVSTYARFTNSHYNP